MSKIIIIGLLVWSVSTSPMAAGFWHGGTIRTIYPLADGSVIVTFYTDHANCESPEASDRFYLRVGQNGMTQQALMIMFGALTNAASSGKTVNVYFSNDTAQCYVNRLVVNY